MLLNRRAGTTIEASRDGLFSGYSLAPYHSFRAGAMAGGNGQRGTLHLAFRHSARENGPT
jgi:hypothetical protein